MSEPPLTRALVRQMLLAAQGLSGPLPRATPTAASVLAAIQRMHALQIDTISVVARSQYLVLWSRIGDYDRALLDGLLARQALFEHWSHAACLLDIGDYPLYRRMMLDAPGFRRRHEPWLAAHAGLVETLLAHIRDEGAVRSADFERPPGARGAGWWDWKEEKVALELLFARGDLVIARRAGFQRIYDLRERVLPGWDDADAPPYDDARRELVLRSVRSLGVGRPDWVADDLQSLRLPAATVKSDLRALQESGSLVTVDVEGWNGPGFVHPENLSLIGDVRAGTMPASRTALLSPFDPVVRDRSRALELFGFDYRIECYTPAPKRRYGYFTLPILWRGALVGRLDPKAHRKEGVFEVRSLHLEPGVKVTVGLAHELRSVIRRLGAWHGTPEVRFGEGVEQGIAARLA